MNHNKSCPALRQGDQLLYVCRVIGFRLPPVREHNSGEFPQGVNLRRGFGERARHCNKFGTALGFQECISFRETFPWKWLCEPETRAPEGKAELLGASWLETKSTQFGFLFAFRVCNFLRLLNTLPQPGLVNKSNWGLEVVHVPISPLAPCCRYSESMHCVLPQRCSMHRGSQCLEPAILRPEEGCFLLLCLLSLGMRKIGWRLECKV